MEVLVIIFQLFLTGLTFGLGLAAIYRYELPESWSDAKKFWILVPYFTLLFAPGAVWFVDTISGVLSAPFGMDPSYIPGYMAILMSVPVALQTAEDKKILKACLYFLVALSLSWNPVAASVPLTWFVISTLFELVGMNNTDHM